MNDRMSVAGAQDGLSRAPLQAALDRPMLRRMRLDEPLESAFHRDRQAAAIANIRAYSLFVVLAIAAIAAATFGSGLVTGPVFSLVVFGYVTVFVAIALLSAGARLPAWQGRIDDLLAVAAFVVLSGMLVGTTVVQPGSALRSIAEYGVILVTIATCTISGMSCVRAVVVIVAANAVFLVAGLPFLDLLPAPDWLRYPFHALGAVLIAAMMGLSQEVRARTVFLQERLLVLEKQELDELAGELSRISRQDALTGLSNRRHFDEVIAREWAACQREGLLMNLLFIDVDYFKHYNDHYGHQAGDECLARIGAVLAEQARRGADFVARYGGEEFVAFFPRTNRVGLEAIARRIVEAVDALAIPHAASAVASHVTVSIGLAAVTPAPEQSPEQLIQAADAALYRRKQAGRHGFDTAWEE